MNEFLVGVYKEVGKTPDIVKIKNDKSYLERLLDGEYITQDYDDYTILYKKDSQNLLPNIYINQYSKIGISLKGKVFAVSKDENDNLKSLNKDQAKRCITFFLRESFNYKILMNTADIYLVQKEKVIRKFLRTKKKILNKTSHPKQNNKK